MGRTRSSFVDRYLWTISTHSPRAGRTSLFALSVPIPNHFNSLAPCGANQYTCYLYPLHRRISTHSPRAGRTITVTKQYNYGRDFNSLAPCGANRECTYTLTTCILFQLTRPVRGEPGYRTSPSSSCTFQLTRPVRGEPYTAYFFCRKQKISTHSPRAGRTRRSTRAQSERSNFNSLAPCGANQAMLTTMILHRLISTHSPRAGRTAATSPRCFMLFNFNSLAPCGANHRALYVNVLYPYFNSLAPCGANQCKRSQRKNVAKISTHSPRAGRTNPELLEMKK